MATKKEAIKAFFKFLDSCDEAPDIEETFFAGWAACEKLYTKRIEVLEEYKWKYEELGK